MVIQSLKPVSEAQLCAETLLGRIEDVAGHHQECG
jgi:hypothetical protein